MAQWNDLACLFGIELEQWLEDPVWPQLRHRWQMQLGSDPWPGNFHMPWVWLKWGEKKNFFLNKNKIKRPLWLCAVGLRQARVNEVSLGGPRSINAGNDGGCPAGSADDDRCVSTAD